MNTKMTVFSWLLMAGLLLGGVQAWAQEDRIERPERTPRGPGFMVMVGELMERLEASESGLSLDEVREIMPNMPEPMFNRLDQNNDGVLTHAEVSQMMDRWRERMAERPESAPRMRPERIMAERRERLESRERDGDAEGRRPRSALRRDVQLEEMSDAERARYRAMMMWERLLDRADTDGSGSISREEFEAAYPNMPADRFDALDHNDDGVITRSDIRGHLEDGTFPGLWGRQAVRPQRELRERDRDGERPWQRERLERQRRAE